MPRSCDIAPATTILRKFTLLGFDDGQSAAAPAVRDRRVDDQFEHRVGLPQHFGDFVVVEGVGDRDLAVAVELFN